MDGFPTQQDLCDNVIRIRRDCIAALKVETDAKEAGRMRKSIAQAERMLRRMGIDPKELPDQP